MAGYTFRKNERLKSETLIKELFSKGSSFHLYPFRIIYRPSPAQHAVTQALFSVPARSFKKAVDRNKLKRRAREAYRIQKAQLIGIAPLTIGFIYSAKKIESFEIIQTSMTRIIEKLNGQNQTKISINKEYN